MKKLLCLSMVAICLLGCSSEKESSLVCTMENSSAVVGDYEIIETFLYEENDETEENEVVKQIEERKLYVKDDKAYDFYMKNADRKEDAYEKISGVSFEMKGNKSDLVITETITMNYAKMDVKDITTLGQVYVTDKDVNPRVNLRDAKNMFKQRGYTCKDSE